jgi:hypothetical protein
VREVGKLRVVEEGREWIREKARYLSITAQLPGLLPY